MTFDTRSIRAEDVPACVSIVNHIIGLGGSTAYSKPYTHADFATAYVQTAPVSNVTFAEGRLVGFQAAFDDGPGIYSIGSFTDRQNPTRGAGRALFAKTLADCRAAGGTAILAKITSDNTGGLAFYTSLGFDDVEVIPNDLMRPDGQQVDRIIKRFLL